MMTTALRRGVALPLLCACLAGCGRKPAPPNSSDPNTPAVVKLPPVVLASDTAKPDTMESHMQKVQRAQGELVKNYALLGAAMAFGDRQMIASLYVPDATLTTPDSTYKGFVAIANALAALGPPRSLADFRRQSLGFRITDSTLTDSGTYVTVTKRAGGESITERGSYHATWRIRMPPQSWALTSDALRPSGKAGKKG